MAAISSDDDDSTGINDGVLRSKFLFPLLLFGGEEVLAAAAEEEVTSEAEAAVDISDDEATEIEDVFAEDKVICSILVLLM